MAKTQYLDLTGLTKYDEEIKAHINSIASGKANSSHTHNYAGSSSAGGAATSANKINTDAGSATNPVYFSNGVPVKTTYTLGKSVPSNAVFTDTTYGVASSSTAGLVKIGFTESGKNYPVELNSDGQMFVNVPWVNTTYTSLKNPNKLTIKGAGTSVEAYDGSAVGEVNIVAGSNVSVSASDGTITISSTDTNTHYKAVPHAGTSSSTSATATTNGNTYINIVENGSRSGGVNIKGSGATTVTSDSNGVITISSTDTNTDTNTTYTLSGALSGNTFVNTLNPSSGSNTTATVPAMTAASSSSAGKAGLVPAPASGKQASFLRGDGTWVVPTDTDTKNTAGSTDTSNKIFLVGATSQAVNPQTYSHDTAYVGTDGCLYSNSTKVSVEGHTHSYAGSSSVGGSANSAVKLDSSDGSATQPVYFSSGKPVACTYTLGKSVPSDAKFTDTTYTSLKNPYALTIQGNGTTLTNGTYDGSDAKTVNITPSAIGAAPRANGQYTVTTEGTGSAYTATLTGLSALSAGVSFIMIPNVVSTSTVPTLDVNGLGVKAIRRRLSNSSTSLQSGYSASWLAAGVPYRVTYDGTYWVVEGQDKPAVADLYGLNASATELNYCKGVTSAIQTQLDSKVSTSITVNGKALSSNISLTYSDVGAVQNGGVTGQDGTHSMALSWNGSDVIAGIDNNAAVKTLIDKETIRTAVTIDELPSGCSATCYYYPDLGMCFLRLYYTGKALTAATVANVGLVPSGYRPNSRFALSVACAQDYSKSNMAFISTDGIIKYIPEVAKEAADDAYITGFWFV